MLAACFVRPNCSKLAYSGSARTLHREHLREVEDESIREVVKLQEDIGLQGITDGELRRDYWHLDFLTRIGGVVFEEGHNPLKWHRQDGVQLEWVPPEVKVHGRITRPHPIQVKDFEFVESITSRTAKVCIPSPSMMIVQGGEKIIDPNVYPDRDQFFGDLSRAYAEEVADLSRAGCRYLQLDDTFLAFLCDDGIGAAMGRSNEDTQRMARLSARLINDAIRGQPKDMAVCIHLCRGNYQSSWLSQGGYDPIAEILLAEIAVDGYFLEYDDERSGDFAPRVSYRRARRSCSASSALNLPNSNPGMLSSGALTTRRKSCRSSNLQSARNADFHRPRKVTLSLSTTREKN